MSAQEQVPALRPAVRGRVAIITGASRGIGRECALALARLGCHVVIAAKSDQPQPTLPGTIFTVAEEVERLGTGARALPFKVDVRSEAEVEACVRATVETFGRVDILINNASALWWQDIPDTPLNKYNLINEVNARGSFLMAKACLPHMKKGGYGHIISMSPPLSTEGIAGHTAYYISKFGMTIVALGAGQESPGVVAGNSLWPKTVVESLASENFEMGSKSLWRKALVISDSVLAILSKDPDAPGASGNMWIDEDLLRSVGVTDFVPYRCDPEVEPPSMADLAGIQGREAFKRGKALKTAPKHKNARL